MQFSVLYVAERLIYRVFRFFYDWYVRGPRRIAYAYFLTLKLLDQSFAIRETTLHFFEPLYRDYSAVGRVLGVVFRSARIFLGAVFYILVGGCCLAVALAWIAIPIVLVILGFSS